MSSQSSTANQEELRAKKGKAPMMETKLLEPKEEGNEGSNFAKIYRTDLFALWSMDTNMPVNMGMVCKGWLKAQQPKVTSVFVGPLVTQLCIALGYQARMEWTEEIMKGAAMTPLSLKDLSTLNISQTRRMRKRAREIKRKLPKLPKVEVEPPPPSSSLTTPQPNTPRKRIHTSSENQHDSPPVLSPSNSIFNDSVAPSAKSPTPA
nr:hypothetical protein Iba_chr13bCG10410 [Ipomoea batatas]